MLLWTLEAVFLLLFSLSVLSSLAGACKQREKALCSRIFAWYMCEGAAVEMDGRGWDDEERLLSCMGSFRTDIRRLGTGVSGPERYGTMALSRRSRRRDGREYLEASLRFTENGRDRYVEYTLPALQGLPKASGPVGLRDSTGRSSPVHARVPAGGLVN